MKQFYLLIGLIVLTQTVKSQTNYTWNGLISTNWNTPANWTPNGVPGAADNVKIVSGGYTCILSANTGIGNLTLTSGLLDLAGYTFTMNGATIVFTAGTIQNGTVMVSGASNTTWGNGPLVMNCVVNVTSAAVTLKNTSFQNTTTITKTGASNDASAGGNVFSGMTTINNAGSGYLVLGSGSPDQFNAAATFNNTGSSQIYIAYNSSNNIFGGITTFNNTPSANTAIYVGSYSAGTLFNDNIVVTSPSGQGVQFCNGNTTAQATLAAGKTITTGAGGFTAGVLLLKQFVQVGATAQNLTLTGAGNLTIGPSSSFDGAVTATSPDLYLNGAIFNGVTNFTKTGSNGNFGAGGNTFNGVCNITNNSSGYFLLGNVSPDRWNADVTFTDNGSERILPCWGSAGNQFNGNIYVNTSGSAQGIQFCGGNTTATATLAATKTIQAGTGGLTAGYLYLKQFTQSGNAPINITATGTSSLYMGPNSSFGGNVNASFPDLYFNGAVFNGTSNFTKTGSNGDFGTGGNTFNGISNITNSGSSYLVLGNTSPDTWNNDVTFTDNGSERLLPCWGSAGNQFNGNIYVNTSGSAQGIQFCGGNTAATATLAATKTIQAGTGGLTAGYLYLRQFTQLGSAPINLTATGTAVLDLGPSSNFGGAFSATAPDIWAQGATYNSPASFTKTGGSSNHNNQYQNIFNSTCTINQQSNGGYFMLGYNSNDLFNDNITVTSTGTGGIYLGWSSGTGTPTLAAGKTVFVGSAGFSSGFLNLNTFTQSGTTPMNLTFTGTNTYLSFARNSVIGGNLTTSTPDIYFNGAMFNGSVNATKTGAGNDGGAGGNTFQSPAVFNNTGSGYLIFGNGNADTWNSDATFNNTGSYLIGIGWNSAGNAFNGNITVTSTGSATGIQFCANPASTVTLSAGHTIQAGAGGFSSGTLYLRQFTQLGNTPISLNLTGATTLLQVGPSSAFGGTFTSVSPRFLLNGAVYSDVVTLTKTGATGEWSYGGNTFNSTLTVNQNGGGYFGFANGAPDIYNGDVYANNNSTDRIIFGNAPVGNQFNGNIILTQVGSSVGIAFGWNNTTNETLAAGKTISVGAAGFNTGYLQIQQFTQLGNAPVNLPLTGNSSLIFGPTSQIGGAMTSTSGSLYFNGCTFNGTVNASKTGTTSDASSGNNIFNGATTITNSGSGYLLFGNGNSDQFNTAATFNNTGSSNIYVAYNSTNNIFGGVTTFNNTPTANSVIYVSNYSSGTLFNDNIVVTSNNGQGVQFCTGNTTASATLASGKTITAGAGGFSAGTLLLRQFTQTGSTAQNLTLTGTGTLVFGPSAAFGGNVTTVSPALYFNGGNFSGTVTSAKNGSGNDASIGNNTFNGPFTITNTGSGYFLMGNGNPDIWQSTATFNNLSSGQHMYAAYNSTGNIFNGDVVFNNQPGSNGLWIYPNYYGINTQFNGNISLVNVNGGGINFGASTGTSTLASGKTISVGGGGFNYGGLVLRNFTQTGSGTAQNITTSGSSYIQYGGTASFDGSVTSSSPGLLFNGSVFKNTVNCTKTGTTNDQSQGNNIFNGASTFTDNGTGYLLMTINNPDVYNSDVTFVQSNTGRVYPNYNGNSTYAGNIAVTSTAGVTAVTFGAGNGTATLSGSSLQNISATSGTPAPIFSNLVVSNTGGGVTLSNTPISVSANLVLTSGLLNTTTTNILTMLNGSSTAAGTAASTSYVNGPMRYQKSSAGTSTLNFPIGTSPDCRPVILTVNHSSGSLYTYQAQLFDASAVLLGYTLPPSVTRVSNMHYYTIGRTNSSGVTQPTLDLSGNQTIQVFFGPNDYASDGSFLTVVKNTYLNPTKWIDIGGVGGPAYSGGSALSGSITSTSSPTAFNSFSTFALGNKIGGGNVLPIGLLSFTALAGNDRVDLGWVTSTESNNSYFTVERSRDGIGFDPLEKVGTAALNGNSSSPLNYATQDLNPFAGLNYYRLKQTDLDGNSTYSAVRSVNFDKKQTLSVYPNPSRGTLHISGVVTTESHVRVEWYDMSGRLVVQETAPVQGSMVTLDARVNNGIYWLRLITSAASFQLQNVIIMK